MQDVLKIRPTTPDVSPDNHQQEVEDNASLTDDVLLASQLLFCCAPSISSRVVVF
jgi:hypothetical protein